MQRYRSSHKIESNSELSAFLKKNSTFETNLKFLLQNRRGSFKQIEA
ncbi:hypothetical protein LEP1GSC103_3315 [Leptospira borgpetersenii serovar Javanica str. UI 09931]|uniref:Uncharacterized protein n=5 Tax=Leptospira borgpetersenii TaxID=174 RepID=M3GV47_LEPBO|nr:hypothetical protein LEP1GSC128_2759 [Leptospira borgpetersenii str. 200801926]EKQ90592.1 hypothetical protein LEP1GSC101_0333 [Leptospira borgpetersenii str. UI 09149]EKR01496.1 hypothetical protein LEP1GSC121_4202 [Leptospira borgpetersenii serovar Castellonis str. 200801910]EMF98713.1 hypothetical protein LEP1GSC123_2926 [Leptospira borgpetersenii str. 200701203]EMK12586.1 hypothetical protein LEP1GSC066_2988 [Leptospira sp. serovar Kenya str. Sh9]EMN14826.1 hypothetical protein LEP1GSC0